MSIYSAPSNVIATGVRAVNKADRQQTALLTCVALVSKDTAGFLLILAIHAIDISARRERKAGSGEEERREGGREKGGNREREIEREGERLIE